MRHVGAKNPDDWQDLRKDKRSAVVVLATIAAGMASVLALLGILLNASRAADRANPIYWVLLLPFAWWAASLANYAAWAVKTLRPANAAATLISFLCAVFAAHSTPDPTLWLVASAITVIGAFAATLLFPGSLLARRMRPRC
jgi:cytochrome bd-type quinol oxidase subunit 2